MESGFLLEAQIPPDCRFNRGSWTSKTPMPDAGIGMGSSIIDGVLYVTGGFQGDISWPTLFTYDPVSDTWDSTRTPIPYARGIVGGQSVVDGKWYLVGGLDWEKIDQVWVATPLARVDVYDPQTDSWELGSNMPEPLGGGAVCTLDGKIYVTGGMTDNGTTEQFFKSVYMYDPELDEWTSRADMISARGFHMSLVYGGKIYVFGGTEQGDGAGEVYDPEQDQWTAIASIPQPVQDYGGCVLDNAIYLLGGVVSPPAGLPYIQKYLPDEDQWSMYGLMPDGIRRHMLHLFGETMYLFGGYRNSEGYEKYSDAVDAYELSKLALDQSWPDTTIPKKEFISLDLSEYFSHMEEEPITYTVCLGAAGVVSDSLDGSMLVLHGLDTGSVQVHVRVESGIDEYGSQFSVTVDHGVSVHDVALEGFKLYPNPAGDILKVQMQKDGPHDYRIYAASGQLVAEGILKGASHSINISTLNKGMYFLKVNSPKLAITQKFIKL